MHRAPQLTTFRNIAHTTLAVTALALAPAAFAQDSNATLWNFDSALAPAYGPGTIAVRGSNPAIVQFGSASSFGLPLLPGGDSGVMRVPAFTAAQGLLVDHNAPPNGPNLPGQAWVNNYTIIMDILWPTASANRWRSLYNTNLTNANDGDMFIDPSGGIGISSRYSTPASGVVGANTWHRVAFVIGAADVQGGGSEGLAYKFIDGRFVGGQGGTGTAISSRWGLFANAGASQGFVLFGDENGETAEAFVSSFKFVPRRMTQQEIEALGGPTANGIDVAGTPAVTPAGTARRIGIIAHRGDSGAAPENTLASIERALQQCVEAIEVDIRLSSDGVAVAMHDSTLDRTTDLSGNTVAFTASQLAQGDNGSWFSDAYAQQRVPTVAQVLRLAQQYGNGATKIYLDIKVSNMGPAILAAMNEAGADVEDVWLWAPGQSQVNYLAGAIPGARMIGGFAPPPPAQAAALRAQGVVGFDYSWGSSALNPTTINLIQSNGMFVSTFTLNDPERILQAINLGLDYIETDFPALMNSLMTGSPTCTCDALDFNDDGLFPDDADLIDFLTVLAGGPCSTSACNDIDFNNDGLLPDDADLLAFLTVLAGGNC